MWWLPTSVKIFVARKPVDLRKSFGGLSVLVENVIRESPISGHLFCFYNRRQTLVRILYWDTSGWCLWSKKLAEGRFHFDEIEFGEASAQISAMTLASILEGIDLTKAKRHKRLSLCKETHERPCLSG